MEVVLAAFNARATYKQIKNVTHFLRLDFTVRGEPFSGN